MATTVVHIRNVKPGDDWIYIGRAMPRRGLAASKWGNPYRINDESGRDAVIEKYRHHLLASPELLAALPELRGKKLACWCKPKACHGDVLAELADGYELDPVFGQMLQRTPF